MLVIPKILFILVYKPLHPKLEGGACHDLSHGIFQEISILTICLFNISDKALTVSSKTYETN